MTRPAWSNTSVTITLTEEQLTDIGDFLNNVLVIHGMTVDLDGEGDGEAAYEASLPVACGDVNEVGFFDEAESFDVDITALNESGVSGTAHLELLGDLLMVDISLTGLEAGMHPMHIHGLETGDASCPTMDLDTNGNGYIELEEGLPAYGGVLLTLGMPTTDESGELEFSGSYIIDPAVLGDLLTRTIIVHGMTADLDGEGEGEAEYVASLPVGCGDLDTPDEPEPIADAYTVMLDAQNESGVSGSVLFTLDGDQLTVAVTATGLTPDQTHMMHIHGLETGEASCPTIDLDANEDGFVDLTEGAVAYGGVLVPLGEPMADAGGNLVYETTLNGRSRNAAGADRSGGRHPRPDDRSGRERVNCRLPTTQRCRLVAGSSRLVALRPRLRSWTAPTPSSARPTWSRQPMVSSSTSR